TLMAPALPVPYLVGVWIANLTISDDRVAHLGRNPFTDDDGCDDDEQNERHLGPGERRDRGVERETDAAAANQPQHRGLAEVGVPTEYRTAGNRRQNLRHDTVRRDLRAARAGCAHRLDLGLVDLLDRFVEQLGAETDRAQPDRQDPGEHARPDDGA